MTIVESVFQVLTADFVTFILFEIVFFLVMGFFIWVGSEIAQVRKNAFLKAIGAALIATVISSLLIIPFASFAFFTLFLALLINIAVVKIVFRTGWRKALVTWVFSVIAQVLVLLAAILLLSSVLA